MNVEQVVEEFLKLVNEGKVEQAEKLIVKQAKEREDELAGILLVTGAKIGDEGNYSVALRCFETARKIVKSEAMKELVVQSLGIAHNNYAILLYEINRFEEAEDHYKKALDINPEDADAHNNYAILLYEINRFEEAEDHYKKALDINPEYADAHYNYAILLEEINRFEEAEDHYKKALNINPEDAKAHNNYAILLEEINRFEEAEDHYKKALEINPEYAKAYGNLGILYSDQKKYSKAVKSLEKASKIFKEKNMLFDHKKAEGLKLSTQAKLLWREESWEDIKKSLEKALTHFKACGMDYDVTTCNAIYALVIIDQSFNRSLESETLVDLREKIKEIHNDAVTLKEELEESKIHEYKIFAAKFTGIHILEKALTFTPYTIQDLYTAKETLRKEKFTKAVESLNYLENFVTELHEFKDTDLENIPPEKEQRLLMKLKPMKYLNGYLTAGAFQEIQKLEPWRKSPTPIATVNFGVPAKKWVRVGIVQVHFSLKSCGGSPVFPPTPENPHHLKEKILECLEIAVKENLDIVLFPELSLTPEILKTIKKKKTPDTIVIGGSYYLNRKNVCPVLFNDQMKYVEKIHPSKYSEFSPINGKGMIPGNKLQLFVTPAGKFIVLICEDFRDELPTVLSQVSDVDFLFVTSYNPNPDRFHEIADWIPSNYPMYILQSNAAEINEKFGKSCIFGVIDNDYAEELRKEGLRSGEYRHEVSEINGEGMLIAEFNIVNKSVSVPTPVEYPTIKNVKVVNL
ncbi:MAG: tetratricopeptide repeat protein [Theionarchaea archaeon]|nr:tetratricopeptide repeat protein [Theionarchaea archaeon]